jgi:hypothetical protein
MANVSAVCTSYKVDQFNGIHAFGTTVVRAATTADTFKAALYLASGSLGAATTAYSATSEVSGTGYTAGGVTVTNATAPTSSGTTAYWTPSGNFAWTTLTASAFDTVLLYNSTQSNKAVAVYTFGSQSVTASNFTLTMPVNASGTALLQLT